MQHIALTPFGRAQVTLSQIAAASQVPAPALPCDKWHLLDRLRAARARFGLTDRALTVLQALLSFLPGRELRDGEPLVVFPSNARLSERTRGMPESTLRRHLAALLRAGLLLRRDSPNGKRYVRRDGEGQVVAAYGFDLRPLLLRAADLEALARAAEAEDLALSHLRTEVSVLLRDALKLAAFLGKEPEPWLLAVRARLRRRLERVDLEDLVRDLVVQVEKDRRCALSTEGMSGSDSQNERHIESHIQTPYESSEAEAGCEDARPKRSSGGPEPCQRTETRAPKTPRTPGIPLELLLTACPEVLAYAATPPRRWRDLVDLAEMLRGYMGIGTPVWTEACHRMGPELAAGVLAAMLQRFGEIRNPGGYLRQLTRQHGRGQLNLGGMIHALLMRQDKRHVDQGQPAAPHRGRPDEA
ncbi:plasmid replication protein RepC [Rubellimicrobium roseum]|uniref:Replication initiation protein n=1 Tax=Rubellimicrobium roseum TaxID=687525 RepID=A0A5C4N5I5_9RHOB|nr:plasmid replication protein RepC [Rubellimicrobium roseum]TNC59434.1 replication initiation protein [Rubellimicrobium roseum]